MPKVNLNHIEINYLDEGEGPVLLMIHNLTSNIQGFGKNIPELSKYYRVIAPDLRGHGYTTHCENYEQAEAFYTFDNIIEDITQLLDNLEIDDFYLFGQAYWGVSSALHLFDRFPKRIHGIVIASAYMLSTDPDQKPYDLLGEAGRNNFLRMHQLAREGGMMAVYNDRLESGQFWSEKVLNSPEILAEFTEAHKLTSPVAFVTIPFFSHYRRASIVKTLNETQIPLMVLMGEYDKTNTAVIENMRADYDQSQCVILPESGHYPTIENPHDFNWALLNFYAGVQQYQ